MLLLQHEKMAKKQAKREKAERQAQEIKRVSEILQLQSLLDLLGGDKVREDFKTGKHGAVVGVAHLMLFFFIASVIPVLPAVCCMNCVPLFPIQ